MFPKPPFSAFETVDKDIAGKIFQRRIQFGVTAHSVYHHGFSGLIGGIDEKLKKAALDGQGGAAQTVETDLPQRIGQVKALGKGLTGHPEIPGQMPGVKFKTPQSPFRFLPGGNQRVRARTMGVKVETQTQMLFPNLPSSG